MVLGNTIVVDVPAGTLYSSRLKMASPKCHPGETVKLMTESGFVPENPLVSNFNIYLEGKCLRSRVTTKTTK